MTPTDRPMIENIPAELRALPQWVAAGSDKIPINPRTGQRANPADPATWGTFDEARHSGYRHVGFVLRKDDPYTIIDLDNPFKRKGDTTIAEGDPDYATAVTIAERQRKIYSAFDSYTELSQSGTGVHIILRGSIPSGVRRDKVDIYSEARYMICTGNVVNPLPIMDRSELLQTIYQEMVSTATVVAPLEEREQVISDEVLYDMAANAATGAKFKQLFTGDMTGYPSQSEADFALLAILCFYSKSDSQVRRVFRYSELGKRDKAVRNDVYINRSLRRIRAKELPLVDFSKLNEMTKAEECQQSPMPIGVILASSILTDDALAALTILPRQSLLGGWFKAGDYGIIYGKRGLGKSWLAMGIARALAEGHDIGPWKCSVPRRVLYVDGEMALDDFRARSQALTEGPGGFIALSHQRVFDTSQKALCLSDRQQQDELTRLCEEQRIDALFLDNGACLFRSVIENDADEFRDKIEGWLLDLRRRGIAVVLVLHAGRNGAIRGTSKREDAAFWILQLDDAGEPDGGNGARFITRFVKNRNASQDPPPLNWSFEPNGEKTLITYREADSMAILLQWISDGLNTCGEIAEEMGLSKGQVSKLAKRAEREGRLTKHGRNYSIKEP